MVEYVRLHTIQCPNVVRLLSLPSLDFEFNGALTNSASPATPPFTYTPRAVRYFTGSPQGTAVVFPPGPANTLRMPDHNSQDAGSNGKQLSMAIRVYYDEAGLAQATGLPLVTKIGRYEWLVNPEQTWTGQHVRLGPSGQVGDVVFANERLSQPGFRVPVQKWTCLGVTIEIGSHATAVSFYLNGELWGPPSVVDATYVLRGPNDFAINSSNNWSYWKGKVDRFTLWQSVISGQEMQQYCITDAISL